MDNISITNDNWSDVATNLGGTSYTVTNKPDGNFCYRVRTAFTFGQDVVPTPFSNVVGVTVSNALCLTNVAAAANGATATASSFYPGRNYTPAGAIDGDHIGTNWEAGGGWNDGTRDVWPDWLEVAFGGAKRIHEIRVYTLQNDFMNPQEPTAAMTCEANGLIDFDVQYWDGSQWLTVPGGAVRGNNLVLRSLTFPEVTTNKIRVMVLNAREHFSRIVEVEAIGCDAQ